jgi:hypothetical protein
MEKLNMNADDNLGKFQKNEKPMADIETGESSEEVKNLVIKGEELGISGDLLPYWENQVKTAETNGILNLYNAVAEIAECVNLEKDKTELQNLIDKITESGVPQSVIRREIEVFLPNINVFFEEFSEPGQINSKEKQAALTEEKINYLIKKGKELGIPDNLTEEWEREVENIRSDIHSHENSSLLKSTFDTCLNIVEAIKLGDDNELKKVIEKHELVGNKLKQEDLKTYFRFFPNVETEGIFEKEDNEAKL